MGLDVFIEADGISLSHKNGATGYVRNPLFLPIWSEDLQEYDFIKETPHVLKQLVNEICSSYQYDIEIADTPDKIIKNLENFRFYYSELIDFLKLGYQLQLDGKHPKIWTN